MTWDIRQTYYYLVCFATLLMIIIGGAMATQSVLDLILPPDVYRPTPLDLYERTRVMRPDTGTVSPVFTPEQLEQMAEEEAERHRRTQQRSSLRRLLGNLALIVIAAPVYAYHWRQVRQYERAGKANLPSA